MSADSPLQITGRKKPVRAFSALTLALLIAGCGGGSPSDDTSASTILTGVVVSSFSDATPLAGPAITPYVSGAQVFLDLNRNLNLDSDESEGTTSDSQGRFSLKIPASVTGDQIAQALVVARASGSDPLLPVPLAAPAAGLGNSSSGPRAINSLTTMVAAEMSAEPGLGANEALTRLRSALPELAERDLFADLSRIDASDPRISTAKLIAANMLAERDSRLQAVAQGLLAISGIDSGDAITLQTGINQNSATAESPSEAQPQGSEAIDLQSMLSQIRTSLPAVKEAVAKSSAGGIESIETLKARIEAATAARKAQLEAEIEASRDEANRVLARNTSVVIQSDDEPLPDPSAISRRIAAARVTTRIADRITLIIVFKVDANTPRDRRSRAVA